jgi:hypothetical protein
MIFAAFEIFIKPARDYNPTLYQLRNDLIQINPKPEIIKIINRIYDIGFQDNFNIVELRIHLYKWIEYLLQNHADLINLESTRSDLIENLEVRNISYDTYFEIPKDANRNLVVNVLSTIKNTKVIGYVNDIFVNLKDFDVAFLHCPDNGSLGRPFFRFFEDNNLYNKIKLIGETPDEFEFNSIPINEVIKLHPSLEHLNYLYLFDKNIRFIESEVQYIVNNALKSVNTLCPFAKSIVFNGIMSPTNDYLNIKPFLAAINNFLENNETNFKFIYIITNNRAILN